jgi:hypothetical protein
LARAISVWSSIACAAPQQRAKENRFRARDPREGVPTQELKRGQEAVAGFAQEAVAYMDKNRT